MGKLLQHFPGLSSKFCAYLAYLLKAKKICFSKCERFLTLEFQPQNHGVASSGEGESGFTSPGGYAKKVCFQ
jgi:hypothetical protein